MNFPSSPVLGQFYAVGQFLWSWNGTGWELISTRGRLGVIFIQENITTLSRDMLGFISFDET